MEVFLVEGASGEVVWSNMAEITTFDDKMAEKLVEKVFKTFPRATRG